MAAASGDRAVDDVPVDAAWARLKADTSAVLIDVRTRAEWTFVGVPDLGELGREPVLIEWQAFPDNRPNAGFLDELTAQLERLGASKSTELFFICRSGARSMAAARAAAGAGYSKCHNVAAGFEGPIDPATGHRGLVGGWKAAGLPWSQG